MAKDQQYYTALLTRYLENRCTPAEVEEVLDYIREKDSNRVLLSVMKESFTHPGADRQVISHEQSERVRTALEQHIHAAPVIAVRSWKWLHYVAAASVILFFCTALYWMLRDTQAHHKAPPTAVNYHRADIKPGTEKAVLTLGDGSVVRLADSLQGIIGKQGHTDISNLDGKLMYHSRPSQHSDIAFNTVSTPRGGQYQVQLPDGSQVWLNAASAVTFPTAFSGKERIVELTGEAYFEVTENKSMPFIVKMNNATVTVLGTHFNIMAYGDESTINTTLLQGSVKIADRLNQRILKPGQQARVKDGESINVLNDVNVDEIMAWKNGFFHFEKADLPSILRQLSRWYDMDIVYQNKHQNELLYADIPRNTMLSDVLKALEMAGSARFEIEGKKIIVK